MPQHETARRGRRPGAVRLVGPVAVAVVAVLVVAGCALTQGDADTDADTRADGRPSGRAAPLVPSSAAEDARQVSPRKRRNAEPAPRGAEPRRAKRPPVTYLVVRVVDGDTIELGNGETVRLVGIDTPERGECGYGAATANMERLVLGRRVRLSPSDEDRDRYGRLLRYVDVGKVDAGLRQIDAGLALARYDSRDGYGYHPRENRYIATDRAAPDQGCR